MLIRKYVLLCLLMALSSIFAVSQAADSKSLSEYTDGLLKDRKVDESTANNISRLLHRRDIS